VKELDEKGLLLRALAEPRFRLVFVPYSHYNTVRFVKQLLTEHYSERPVHEIDLEKQTVPAIIPLLEQIESGILYLYNFDVLLKSEHLRTYLNQRRDWLASRPLAIIAFVNNGANIPLLAKGIKDLYSFRTLVLYDLEKEEGTVVKSDELITLQAKETSIGFGPEVEAKVAVLYEHWKEVLEKKDDDSLMTLLMDQLMANIIEHPRPRWQLDQLRKIEKDLSMTFENQLPNDIQASIHYYLASALSDSGDTNQAVNQYLKALSIKPQNKLYLLGFSNVLIAVGQFDKAIEVLDLIVNGTNNSISSKLTLASAFNNLGSAYCAKDEYVKAIYYHEKALSLYQEIVGNDNPLVGGSLNNIGSTYEGKGENDLALDYYEKALLVFGGEFGSWDARSATTLNNIGNLWSKKGELEKALSYYGKALLIWQQLFDGPNPYIASTLNNIGFLWDDKGDYSKSLTYYEKALANDLDASSHKRAIYLNNIGRVYSHKGDHSIALGYLEEALSILKKFYPDEHSYIDIVNESIVKTHSALTPPQPPTPPQTPTTPPSQND
jgi:tetratricopeptide (TPR) repeat protein